MNDRLLRLKEENIKLKHENLVIKNLIETIKKWLKYSKRLILHVVSDPFDQKMDYLNKTCSEKTYKHLIILQTFRMILTFLRPYI